MTVKELQSLKKTTISYTKKEQVLLHNINNVSYNIDEFYNEQNKKYYYVLNLQKHPLTDNQKQNKVVPYNVIKFSVGASPNKETNSFFYVASSPVWINFENLFVKDGAYFLFSTKKALNARDFQEEGIFSNSVPEGNKKIGEETYRFITNETKGVISE
ncbi:hypothetical protein [Bacillus salipaludis]|uniref:Uncharacterized protein n=1 Tax=Bacillus salipaludis TaxID=2547811 RepID=A0AA90RAE0_9BACI|nr:hypothetical protein [Bacillus salipaludis]MDQ6600693.1 hypothetical protein [Bacillus salipaludis]